MRHHARCSKQLGVIGCGLMGGSFALAMKRAGLVRRVIGYSKSPSTTEQAKRLGIIDTAAESALLAVSGSDMVLIAVPVSATEATFKAIRHGIEDGTLVMDVGSTKRDVVDAARRVLKDHIASFVPAHPIAGKEVAGIGHADAALYQGRQVILTPLAKTLARARPEERPTPGRRSARRCCDDARGPRRRVRGRSATCRTSSPSPSSTRSRASPAGRDYLSLGGPGFRDFTRHRREQPAVWRDILMANREEILKQTQRFPPHARRDGARHQDRQHRSARGARSAAPATRAPAGR
jgi:prephenate dehydrogenase